MRRRHGYRTPELSPHLHTLHAWAKNYENSTTIRLVGSYQRWWCGAPRPRRDPTPWRSAPIVVLFRPYRPWFLVTAPRAHPWGLIEAPRLANEIPRTLVAQFPWWLEPIRLCFLTATAIADPQRWCHTHGHQEGSARDLKPEPRSPSPLAWMSLRGVRPDGHARESVKLLRPEVDDF
jgi:hypothetical protein